MMRFASVKFTLSCLCLSSLTQAVSNKEPYSQIRLTQQVNKSCSLLYKGIYPINNYGWFLTKKKNQDLNFFKYNNTLYPIQYSATHTAFGITIFKINSVDLSQEEDYPKLEFLATQEDLQYYYHWVTSLAFIPHSSSSQDILSDEIETTSKPLSAITKITKQENGRLLLTAQTNMQQFYQETWDSVNALQSHIHKKNYSYICKLSKDLNYKQYYLDSVQVKKLDLTQQDLENLWQQHLKDLKQQELNYVDHLQRLVTLSATYDLTIPMVKTDIENIIKNHFRISYVGVADKEDNGGIIHIPSKSMTMYSHGYKVCSKIVGLTDIKESDQWVPGENSFAIDLTTPEVHQWISDRIDEGQKLLHHHPLIQFSINKRGN